MVRGQTVSEPSDVVRELSAAEAGADVEPSRARPQGSHPHGQNAGATTNVCSTWRTIDLDSGRCAGALNAEPSAGNRAGRWPGAQHSGELRRDRRDRLRGDVGFATTGQLDREDTNASLHAEKGRNDR